MKYVTVVFWALVLGEVLGYIGSALESATFDPMTSGLWSVIVGAIAAVLFYTISDKASNTKSK